MNNEYQIHHLSRVKVTPRATLMKPTALQEIRDILEGIKNGTLPHDQSKFHSSTSCGTAHCIAGWKVHQDAVKAGITPNYETKSPSMEVTSKELNLFLIDCDGPVKDWNYASSSWGLNHNEAFELFQAKATLAGQFELLALLEAGYTILDE